MTTVVIYGLNSALLVSQGYGTTGVQQASIVLMYVPVGVASRTPPALVGRATFLSDAPPTGIAHLE